MVAFYEIDDAEHTCDSCETISRLYMYFISLLTDDVYKKIIIQQLMYRNALYVIYTSDKWLIGDYYEGLHSN